MKKVINLIRYYCDYCYDNSKTCKDFIKCLKINLNDVFHEIKYLVNECKEESNSLEDLYNCVYDFLDLV